MNQAFVLKSFGKVEEAFELQQIDTPKPKEGEILIEVEAFGLNYADVMAMRGLYREAPPLPCVIGYEVIGKIVETGSKNDETLLGQRVLAITRFGGYSKYAVTTKNALVEINENEDLSALSLATQGATAYYMTNILTNILPDDKVLVHAAAGGVGSLLTQLCKRKNAKVIAKVSTDEKGMVCLDNGADEFINYQQQDYAESLIDKHGEKCIDVSFNAVAGTSFKKDFKLLNFGGRLVLFGGAALPHGKFKTLKALRFLFQMGRPLPIAMMMTSKSVLGVNLLKIGDHKPELLRKSLKGIYDEHQKKPFQITTHEYSKEQFQEAIHLLASGQSTGKVFIKW